MASNLNAIVAQLNSKQLTPGVSDPEKKKKPPAKPKPAKESGQSAARSKLKGGTADGLPTGTKASALSSKIGQASYAPPSASQVSIVPHSLSVAAPPNPNTAPVLKRVKDVLDALLAHNGTRMTVADLQQATGLNLNDTKLLQELHCHMHITYAGAPRTQQAKAAASPPTAPATWYEYLPEIQGVRDKVALLNYVRDKGPAVLADQLRHCYLKAAEDLAELKREGQVFIIGHTDPEKETVFVRDIMGQEVVQDDVRALWFEVCKDHVKDYVPQDVHELQLAVTKAGLRSALANQPIKRALAAGPRERQKKPRQQRINIDKATNAHLPFLFQAAQPTNIDG